MSEFTDIWGFAMEIMTDVPTEISQCSVVVEEG